MIHILKIPEQTYDEEQAFLDALDKYQRRYLSRFVCAKCEKSLSKACCQAYWIIPACAENERLKRSQDCLKNYKPRPNRRKA